MRLMILAIVLTVLSGVVQAADAPPALPRYQFTVGEELNYREDWQQQVMQAGHATEKPRPVRAGPWQVWVVDKNRDGSWRLIIRHDLLLHRRPKSFVNSVLGYCDVFPDGRVLPNETLGNWGQFPFLIDPCGLFIPLPADQPAMAKGWSAPMPGCALPERGERIFKCSIDASAARCEGSLVINCTEHDPMHAMYDETETRRCVFSVATGRLLEYARESEETGSRKLKTRMHRQGSFKLESVGHRPLPWIKKLKQESEKLFLVKTEYDRQTAECRRTRTWKECKALRTQMRDLVITAQKSAALEPVQEQYAAFLKIVDLDDEECLNGARLREFLYSRAPADWELTAFDGTKHRLADYRGKVVVLDFWFAGCGWCIKSYPQVNQIAAKYAGQGVVVLGMNTDPIEAQPYAQQVIRDMDLKFTVLKASP
ncbi:MAG TPA: TlpA disulfide reductase family protein, partial [Planctomycetaceae bacterium]|nr:TlpA disulfide reductase family protein [Planctomycetaceae bacterium]